MNTLPLKEKHYLFILFMLLFFSCNNDNEIENIENLDQNTEIINEKIPLGIDFSEDEKREKHTALSQKSNAETVMLNKVRVWLWRNTNPESYYRIKVRHVETGDLIVSSTKRNTSTLDKLPSSSPNTNTGKEVFDLKEDPRELIVGEKYRIEVWCNKIFDGEDRTKNIHLGTGMGGDYYPAGDFVKRSSVDGDETFMGEAVFETQNLLNDYSYNDQKQEFINSYKVINSSTIITNDMKFYYYQEFVPSNDDEPIVFEDPNLEKVLKKSLLIDESRPITKSDAKLTNNISIISGHSDISNLGGIEYFTNAESFFIIYQKIIDFSVLNEMKNLKKLSIYFNETIDINTLGSLINLISLELNFSNINDISILKNLTNLISLGLQRNNIIDINALENLSNLISLDLQENNIIDINALENLTNLKSLDLGANNINDISALENLTNLKNLRLDFNNINDLSTLENLSQLEMLDLSYNNISDIEVLKSMTNLEYLDLSENPIDPKDIEELEEILGIDIR